MPETKRNVHEYTLTTDDAQNFNLAIHGEFRPRGDENRGD
jgi:hypothetical protein